MIVFADPSISSDNIGDKIISRYARAEVELLFPNEDIVSTPTQLVTCSRRLGRLLASARGIIVGGSNLLSHRYPRLHQWGNIHQYIKYGSKVHFLGVGWHSYERRVWPFNQALFGSFANSPVHSVRDSYTQKKLETFGVRSINTSCPTLWNCKDFAQSLAKPSHLICTLTYYRRNKKRDTRFLELVAQQSVELGCKTFFWPQSRGDIDYFHLLNVDRGQFEILPSSLSEFESLLSGGAVYVGTRLHAGIHALNNGVPAFIFAIDNRALEISNDVGLPIFTGEDEFHLPDEYASKLTIPHKEIAQFKSNILAAVQKGG
jgi:polysaccharide pyruvyl transferase WcaK-like protein